MTIENWTTTKKIWARYDISAIIVEATKTLLGPNKSFLKRRMITIKTIEVIANVKGLIKAFKRLTLMDLF